MAGKKDWKRMTEDEKEKYQEAQKQKTQELIDKLEEGMKRIYETDMYKDYLDMASKVYQYSPNNQILIMMQKPEATMVQSLKAWNKMVIRGKEYHRSVNKGEKGIKVLVPMMKEVQVTDKNGVPQYDPDGNPITRRLPYRFKIGHVFDISQTKGDELPDIAGFCRVLEGKVEGYEDYIRAAEKACPYKVYYEDTSDPEVKGYCDHGMKKVVVRDDLSEAQTLKTLIHETAHARYHDITDKEHRLKRSDMEIQAESIAYIVTNHFGLDTSDYSFGYVAGWAQGREIQALHQNIMQIQEGSEGMIADIRDALAEIRDIERTLPEKNAGKNSLKDLSAKENHQKTKPPSRETGRGI